MWRGLRLGFSNALPIKPDKEFPLKQLFGPAIIGLSLWEKHKDI